MTVFTVLAQHTFSANCYLVAGEKGNCAIIDPGAEAEGIIRVIQEHGLAPKMILLTHGHFDHIGAVKKLKARYPGLTVSIHPGDIPLVSGDREAISPGLRRLLTSETGVRDDYILEVDSYLSDNQTIRLDELTFTVLETPGHSAGSVCFLCGDRIFTGDTLFHHDVGRTDLYGGSPSALYGSIRRLSKLEQDYIICPGHEEPSSILEERVFFQNFLAGQKC